MTKDIQKRDYGVDLLRLIAMGMIVMHHLLVHGGLAFAFPAFSTSGMAVHLLNALTRCSVNVYALISGYVMVRSRFKASRLIGLWLQVVFYGVLAVVCLPLMGGSISLSELFKAVTPVSHDYYWYFTGYAVVFCLSPFLNLLLNSLKTKQTGLLAIALAGLFSVLPTLVMKDCFGLHDGYHAGWLMILYLLGGAARLHGFGWFANRKRAVMAAMACVAFSWAFRLMVLKTGAAIPAELLLNYTSPAMLVYSMALLAVAVGRKLPEKLRGAVGRLSPLAFGIYLIHDNPLVREYLIRMRLAGLAQLNPVMMLGGLLACWAGVCLSCLLIEWLRSRLFVWLKVPDMCERAEKRLICWADCLFHGADA